MDDSTMDMLKLAELHADATLGELESVDEGGVRDLARRFPGIRREEMDEVASLLQLALVDAAGPVETPPASVKDRALGAMLDAARSVGSAHQASPAPAPAASTFAGTAGAQRGGVGGAGMGIAGWLGWTAAAACIALAGIAWMDRPGVAPVSQGDDVAAASPSGAEALERLLADPPSDLVRIGWTKAGDDASAAGFAQGEVIWSDEMNEGYMVFEGLASNDASIEQYQLWIFDEARSQDHPVDGGVFDIATADGPTVVAIDPRVPITEAVLFAITVEPAGGVVVSTRERLPLVAPVASPASDG